ncbi:hypothetical protein GCM10009765_17820 [Fodinicola feengrottensis]|uniref:Uncharacterized protein n=1 Tax=Fodinicola feengrottensis TaxID=435914 RepID=A0ABN2GCK9_9ACTN
MPVDDDAERTTATVLSAVAVWRRAAAGARPVRHVELRLLVEDPHDAAVPDHEVSLTLVDPAAYRRGQRIPVVVDRRTGQVSLPALQRSSLDVGLTLKVLVGVAVLVAVVGAVTFFILQARQPVVVPPVPTPSGTAAPSPRSS